MKHIYIPFFIIMACITLLAVSCKREYPVHSAYNTTETSAFIKVIHAAPSIRTIFNKPDSLNVYVGSTKINGTLLTYNTAFPTTTNMYAAIPAGDQAIRLTVNGVTNPDSITIVTMQKNLAAGAYYTLLITDSINSAKDSSKMWLQDIFPTPTAGPGYFYLRFVHAVLNDTAGTTVDLYSPRRNQILFSKVAIGTATAFTAFPTLLATQDTLYVRRTGTANILAKLQTVSFADQRAYTVFYIGNTTLTTGTKVKSLVGYVYQ